MAWTTVRCWLMRLGLYAPLRPLEQADDWAYLIDHTVQIGTVKCFAVVGVRLSQLPYPRRCLQREDLVLIALVPMQQSNAMTVKQALEEAELRTGVPHPLCRTRAEMYGAASSSTAAIIPIHPRLATWLTRGQTCWRKLLEGDQRWPEFVAQLGQTKGKLQQTAPGVVRGAVASPQVSFYELGAPAAVGAVLSASARPTLAAECGAVRSSTGGVDENRPRATGGQAGLAAGLS